MLRIEPAGIQDTWHLWRNDDYLGTVIVPETPNAQITTNYEELLLILKGLQALAVTDANVDRAALKKTFNRLDRTRSLLLCVHCAEYPAALQVNMFCLRCLRHTEKHGRPPTDDDIVADNRRRETE